MEDAQARIEQAKSAERAAVDTAKITGESNVEIQREKTRSVAVQTAGQQELAKIAGRYAALGDTAKAVSVLGQAAFGAGVRDENINNMLYEALQAASGNQATGGRGPAGGGAGGVTYFKLPEEKQLETKVQAGLNAETANYEALQREKVQTGLLRPEEADANMAAFRARQGGQQALSTGNVSASTAPMTVRQAQAIIPEGTGPMPVLQNLTNIYPDLLTNPVSLRNAQTVLKERGIDPNVAGNAIALKANFAGAFASAAQIDDLRKMSAISGNQALLEYMNKRYPPEPAENFAPFATTPTG